MSIGWPAIRRSAGSATPSWPRPAGPEPRAPGRRQPEPLPATPAQRHPTPEEEGFHPTAVVHTIFLDRVDGDAAGTILEHLAASDAMMRVAQLRVLGVAMARVPADATAFAHRGSRIMATVVCFYQGPADKPGHQAWLEAFAAALRQGDDGAYTGFLGEDGPAHVHQAYPGSTWDRLVEVKARYDPTNLFRHNHDVPAAG